MQRRKARITNPDIAMMKTFVNGLNPVSQFNEIVVAVVVVEMSKGDFPNRI